MHSDDWKLRNSTLTLTETTFWLNDHIIRIRQKLAPFFGFIKFSYQHPVWEQNRGCLNGITSQSPHNACTRLNGTTLARYRICNMKSMKWRMARAISTNRNTRVQCKINMHRDLVNDQIETTKPSSRCNTYKLMYNCFCMGFVTETIRWLSKNPAQFSTGMHLSWSWQYGEDDDKHTSTHRSIHSHKWTYSWQKVIPEQADLLAVHFSSNIVNPLRCEAVEIASNRQGI
jgi:hypothetical protein